MQEHNNNKAHILYSCYSQKSREGEQFIPHHVFSYTMAGSSEIFVGNKGYFFKEGDFRFYRKNQLARYTKHPPPGGVYKAVSVSFDEAALRRISEEHNLHPAAAWRGECVLLLKPVHLLQNYIESLTPYLDGVNNLSKALIDIKVKEAVMVLLQTNPVLRNILFDFTEPGKIDLEAFMNGHYKYNVTLDRFAYLTGRSLATFKRDFEKIYNTTPNRWMQQKRLNDAFYLIKERGMKSSDVYLEVGFKDLSHFSFAFKKAFGVAPSAMQA